MVSDPVSSVIVRPVDMTVGSSVAIVRAVDVAAWNVMVRVFAAIRQDARTWQFPLAHQEGLGRVGGVNGPNVAGVVGVGAVLRCDHGQVAPVDAEFSIVWSCTTFCIPCFHWVGVFGSVAQEVVVRNRIVNPAVAVECATAAAPFF